MQFRSTTFFNLMLTVVLAACASASATTIRTEDTFITAVGDTLKATQFYKVSGSPDSVRWLFTARNAPSQSVSRGAPPNGLSLTAGPVNLIPSPALLDGDTVTVSACPVAWKKGTSYPGSCSTRLYTRPIVPPVVTGDSLTVIGLDIYPKGTYATTRATGACLRALGPSASTGSWASVWDYTTSSWKPVCKSSNGTLMMLAYCATPIMGDSVRVLTAAWTTKPWCAQYAPQVPRKYVPPPGLISKRQQAADKVATLLQFRTQGGGPPTGWVWEDIGKLLVLRDSVTADAALPAYMVGFMTTRSPRGQGAFSSPDSIVFLTARVYNGDGTPRIGVPVAFTAGPNSGTILQGS